MTDATIAALGEHALIARLRARAGVPRDWVALGIGDDAAAIEPERGTLDILTTDSLVEGVHFRLEWTAARAIGHKALATSLSDLAAMGATPRAALLTLALPVELGVGVFDDLIDGFVALANAARSPLVGGNLTRSPGPLVINVTAVGAARRRRLLTRSGGRPGDELYVTGQLGAAAAGLALLRTGASRTGMDDASTACLERFERPDARVRCGRIVAASRAASACVDLSDGLSDAARQIADASRVGVVIDAAAIPVHPGASAWADRTGIDPAAFALAGGEDYELLFAVPPRQSRRFAGATRRCRDLPVTRIGRLTAEPGQWLDRSGRLEPLAAGFVHF